MDPMEEFFFDLKGFTVLKGALGPDELASINKWIDAREPQIRHAIAHDDVDYVPSPPMLSLDGMQVQSYHNGAHNAHIGHADDGINLQYPYEAAGVFESLIDHPSWMPRVRHYLGAGSQPYLHELFINLRGPGGYIGCHGGGPQFTQAGTQLRSPWGAAAFRSADASSRSADSAQGTHRGHLVTWAVPYMSIIVALADIGEGDGATVCVPSSHKSIVGHPVQQQMVTEGGDVEGSVEMHLKAGEALVFQDSLIHGAAARVSQGWRRTLCFRYLPQECSHDRFGHTPSEACMARLTPARREILTQRAAESDPWGNTHVKLAAAAEGRDLKGGKLAGDAGHSYSKL